MRNIFGKSLSILILGSLIACRQQGDSSPLIATDCGGTLEVTLNNSTVIPPKLRIAMTYYDGGKVRTTVDILDECEGEYAHLALDRTGTTLKWNAGRYIGFFAPDHFDVIIEDLGSCNSSNVFFQRSNVPVELSKDTPGEVCSGMSGTAEINSP